MSDEHTNSPPPFEVRALMEKVSSLELDDPKATLNFTARLRREHLDWDLPHAQRVAREYTRFLILAALADRQVTPSEAVDQAWHLHIIYTESYHAWCNALFGRYLHHGPTKGGKAEGERYEQQYEYTLALYKEVFGEVAPAEIWPEAEVRFDPKLRSICIQPGDYWIVPRRRATRALLNTTIAAATFFLVAAVSTGYLPLFLDTHAQTSENPTRETSANPEGQYTTGEKVILAFFGGIIAVGALVAVVEAARGTRAKKDGGGGCSSWFGCGGGGCSASGCGASGCSGGGCGGGGCGGGCGS